MDTKKRIFLLIGFVGITIFLGWAIYYVFFAPDKPDVDPTTPSSGDGGALPISGDATTGPDTTPVGTELPTIDGSLSIDSGVAPVATSPDQGAVRVLDIPVSGVTSDSEGRAKFYNQRDGKFYRIDDNGQVRTLSDETFFNVDNVTWSPAENESIIEYPDGSNIYYNFDTKQQVTLPRHWQEFSFSPEGAQITAKSMALSPDNRWLITSDPRGNNIELVEPMGTNAFKVIPDWSPNDQVLALSRTGEALGGNRQEVLLVGKYGENFKSLTVEGRDLRTQWSPSGTKLLHSVYSARSDFKPELWVVDADGDSVGANRKLLAVNTWADKCTFSDDRYVYCGVPTSLQKGDAFAPDRANRVADELYRIDVATGSKIEIPIDERYTINTIFLSEDEQTLYFTDKNRTGLFSVAL